MGHPAELSVGGFAFDSLQIAHFLDADVAHLSGDLFAKRADDEVAEDIEIGLVVSQESIKLIRAAGSP
jgi:hypothetical protein